MVVLEPRTALQIQNDKLLAGELVFDTTTSTIKYSIDGISYKTIASSELIGPIGINTTNPESTLEINSETGETLRLTYNDSNGSALNHVNLNVSSTGDLILDATGNNVITGPDDNLVIPAHNGTTKGLILGEELVTASATQLNYNKIAMTGLAEASKALVLDANKTIYGITSFDTVSLSLDGEPVLASADELNYNYGLVVGTAQASKALVLDANKNITGINNINTIGRLGVNTSGPDKQVEINNATGECLRLTYNDADGLATNYTDFAVTSVGDLALTPSGGNINLPTHNGTDKGLKLNGVLVTSTAEELNYVNVVELGVAQANKALVLDENKEIVGIKTLNAETVNIDGKLTVNATDYTLPATNTTVNATVLNWANASTPIVSGTQLSSTWEGICWSPELGIYVAIASAGTAGRIMYASNPVISNWQLGTLSEFTTFEIYAICWSPQLNLFVAGGKDNSVGNGNLRVIITSPDGINWTYRSFPADMASPKVNGITWSPQLGIFVAVTNSKRIFISSNGINWTSNLIPDSQSASAYSTVCWSPELAIFVMAGQSFIAKSSNGINWVITPYNSSYSFNSIVWSPELEMFALTSSEGSNNRIMTSKNGINWSGRYTPINLSYQKIVWSSELSLFVVVANTTEPNNILISSDGITWTNQKGIYSTVAHKTLCWSPERSEFISIAGNKVVYNTKALVGGRDWYSNAVVPIGFSWSSIDWSSELKLFVAVASASTPLERIMTSSDGISWDSQVPSETNNAWSCVKWLPSISKFMAVCTSSLNGSTNFVMTSSDGKTWSSINAPYFSMRTIAYSPTLNLIVIAGSNIMTSPDGINWTLKSNPIGSCYHLIWAGGINKFLGVANGNQFIMSSDGITWTTHTVPNSAWLRVAWSQELSLFVTVSTNAGVTKVMRSPDGINWTTDTIYPANNNKNWNDVIWISELNKFVACSNSPSAPPNNLAYSSDGITWTLVHTPNIYVSQLCWAKELSLIVSLGENSGNRNIVSSFDYDYFLTLSPSTSALGTSMIVDYSGFIGINTSNPERQIEINSSTGDCLRLTNNDSDGSAQRYADLVINGSGELSILPSGQKMYTSDIDTTAVNVTAHNGTDRGLKLAGTLVTSTANELNYVDVATTGTAEASKAVVLDANKNIAGINNVSTIGSLGVNTTTPNKQVEINNATGDCLRLTYNDVDGTATNYTDFAVTSVGDLSLTPSGGSINIPSHNGTDKGLKLNGVLVTSSATELNYTDVTTIGTAQASKALVVDSNKDISGLRSVVAENVNITNEFKLGGTLVTSTATELNYVDVTTQGVAQASKALVVSADKDITGIRTLEMEKINITSEFKLNGSLVTVSGDELNYLDITSAGVAQANKALVVDADKDITGIRTLNAETINIDGKLTVNATDYTLPTTSVSTASPALNWNYGSTPLISGTAMTATWTDSCWSPQLGMYVAVNQLHATHRIIYTTNPRNGWNLSNIPEGGFTVNFGCVTWSPSLGLFVASGSDSTSSFGQLRCIMTSTNGIDWTYRTIPALGSLAFSGYNIVWSPQLGMFMITCLNSATYVISTNGINWTRYSLPFGTSGYTARCVEWSPELGIFSIIKDFGDSSAISTNGINWTVDNTLGSNGTCLSITWSPDLEMFAAICGSGIHPIFTSTDGKKWIRRYVSTGALSTYRAIIWVSELSMFIAGTSSNGTGQNINNLLVSIDGITWTSQYGIVGTSISIQHLTWSPERLELITVNANVTNYSYKNSVGGYDWTYNTSLANYGYSWKDSVWSPELKLYVVVSSTATNTSVITSSDGVNWDRQSLPSSISLNSIAWSPQLSRFVAVSSATTTNNIIYSSNGSTWTLATSPSFRKSAVGWSPVLNIFVCFGQIGELITSSDGINWTTVTPNLGYNVNRVIWVGGINKFLAVGTNRSSLSTNGTTWTTVSPNFGDMFGVAYSPSLSLFVTVGANSRIFTSPDGETWTLVTVSNSLRTYSQVIWIEELSIFVASLSINGTGNFYNIAVSSDGVNWIEKHPNGYSKYGTVCWAKELSLIIAVASSNTNSPSTSMILSSFDYDYFTSLTAVPDAPTAPLGTSMIVDYSGFIGINTNNPERQIEINSSTGDCLRLTYNDSDGEAQNYTDLVVNNAGELSILASGQKIYTSDIDTTAVNITTHNGTDAGLKLAGTLVTSTANELNYVDVATTGTAEASKALVLNATKDISGINSLGTQLLSISGTADAVSKTNGGVLTISGGTAVAKKLYVGDGVLGEVTSTAGNDIKYPLTLTTLTNATVANGIATGMKYMLQTPSSVNKIFGTNEITGTDLTEGSEKGTYTVKLLSNGTLTERLSLSHDGVLGSILYVNETSDRRVKENIVDADPEDSYNKIMQVRITNYNFIGKEKVHRGVIAQELREVIPSSVELEKRGDIKDFHTVQGKELIGYMIQTIQHMDKKIKNLEACLV